MVPLHIKHAQHFIAICSDSSQLKRFAYILIDEASTLGITHLTWKAASRLDAGRNARREAYLARLYAGEKAMRIADYGLQIYGGHGYIREYPMERFYRDARGIAILEGMATL